MLEGEERCWALVSWAQVWVAREGGRGPSLPPHPGSLLQGVLYLGQQVLVNVRRVKSPVVRLQATVLWPREAGMPRYRVELGALEGQLHQFHTSNFREGVEVCLNGLPARSNSAVWSARVKKIVNHSYGIIQVKSVIRDGKKEFSRRYLCIFHKSDVWSVLTQLPSCYEND
mgnify:CR=1 FL=1